MYPCKYFKYRLPLRLYCVRTPLTPASTQRQRLKLEHDERFVRCVWRFFHWVHGRGIYTSLRMKEINVKKIGRGPKLGLQKMQSLLTPVARLCSEMRREYLVWRCICFIPLIVSISSNLSRFHLHDMWSGCKLSPVLVFIGILSETGLPWRPKLQPRKLEKKRKKRQHNLRRPRLPMPQQARFWLILLEILWAEIDRSFAINI